MHTPTLPWDDPQPSSPPLVLRCCVGSSAADRLQMVAEVLGERTVDDWLVLAPSGAQADELVREACAGQAATIGRHRMGTATLALRLALPVLAARSLTPLSALGFDAVVARALASLGPSALPRAFASAAAHPGFLGALAATLREVRLADVEPAALARGGDRGAALAPCLAALEHTLATLQQADRAQVLRLAIAALEDAAPLLPTLDAVAVAIVDPVCATALERRFLAAVCRRAHRALIVGPSGDPGFASLAASLDVDVERLDRRTTGPEDGTDGGREGRTGGQEVTGLRRVQARLFATTDDEQADVPDDGSVLLFSAPGESRECVEVARCLVDAAAQGTPFDDMAVVVRAPQLYASHLETALRRADVPAWFARGTRRPDPTGRAVLALVACALEDLSARRFAEYLSLGQVPTGTPPSRMPWRWEAIVNDAAVIAGHDRWRRRLSGHREELRLRAETLAVDEPESPRLESLQRQIERVDELLAFALPVIDLLSAWRDATASWGVWLDRLRQLAMLTVTRPEALAPVFDQLQPMAAVGDVRLREVFDVLHDHLTHTPVPSPDERYGRVFVGSPDDLRGRHFSLVCVLGLSERVFPQRSRQDPLLLDEDRRHVSPDLALEDGRVADERLRLRLAVGAASARLITSFASFDAAQSRPRVPSFYALDIQRACGGRLRGYDVVLRDAQRASGARLAWPAHPDASRAIDRTEHDLSVLHRYLRGDIDDVRGRGRYLFEGFPSLRRSLVMQHERTRKRWTVSDGLVVEPDARDLVAPVLATHRLHARAYSVSALQRYAVCPYQFFLSTVVRLSPREEAAPVIALDPLTRGSIVHEILATTIRTFEAKDWLPLVDARLPEALREVDAVVDSVAGRHRDTLMPPIERIWLDEVQAIRRDMREWVRRLPDDQRAWTPRYVEFGFGFGRGDGRDRESVAADVTLEQGWRLHGVIDLVEHGADDTWRITDYKTGRNRLPAQVLVNKGETLQPVLYAMALERVTGGRVAASRLWYCTTDGGFSQRDVPVTADHDTSARARATAVLQAVDRAVETGFLPAAPRAEACQWCDFAPVCGPGSQTRTTRKPRAALDDLLEVRRMP